jgi:hypothetical protein
VYIMDKYLAIIILAVFTLGGCAPGVDINTKTPVEEIEPAVTAPALAKVDETSPNAVDKQGPEGETMQAEPEPAQTGQADTEEGTGQEVTAIPPSGVIDLGDISQDQGAQEEGELGELVELPAPGVPNTSTLPIKTAKNDLAKRLDMKVDDITLVAVEPVVWSDSSLGCPAQGANYLMALVKGFRITLEGGGESYTYHTDMNDQVILCEDGQPADP